MYFNIFLFFSSQFHKFENHATRFAREISMYSLFSGLNKVKQSFIADQRIDRLELKRSSGANFSRRKKIRWIEHTWIPPRATMRISRAAKILSLSRYALLFIPSRHARRSFESAGTHTTLDCQLHRTLSIPSKSLRVTIPLERYRHIYKICALLANESFYIVK